MQNILLIYEGGSFEVLSVDEHNRRLSEDNTYRNLIWQEIYRDSVPGISKERCYVCRVQTVNSRWMSLSEFPEETRSLLVLYEI